MCVFYLQKNPNKTAANVCTHLDTQNGTKEMLNWIGFWKKKNKQTLPLNVFACLKFKPELNL